jgi:hypothetical protein
MGKKLSTFSCSTIIRDSRKTWPYELNRSYNDRRSWTSRFGNYSTQPTRTVLGLDVLRHKLPIRRLAEGNYAVFERSESLCPSHFAGCFDGTLFDDKDWIRMCFANIILEVEGSINRTADRVYCARARRTPELTVIISNSKDGNFKRQK